MADPLRIDYVSPLPPVRSGIADYSVDLLPHLAARGEVGELRVVRLAGQEVSAEVAVRWRPVAAEETGREGRLPLYQMGNNPWHEGVLELASERPGVMTLHDLVLHHLLVERTLSRGVFEPYREALERDHGWVGKAVAMPRRWGAYSDAGVFELPAHLDLLRRQRGVLVHGRWAAGMLAEEDPELAVRVVPMGIPLPAAAGAPGLAGGGASRAARERFAVPAAAPLVGSFGFQTPIKRTVEAVRALARPELAGVHLLVVGEVSPETDLLAAARQAGVAERVRVTGFVDPATFEQALGACDVALNLRYPTAGETSASLLRLLAAGRGAVVSDYAQFADLPDDAVVRVPLGDGEVAALAAALAGLLADSPRLAAMGDSARRHVARRHRPEDAAAAVAAACVELARREPPGARRMTAPPPSTAAWPRMAGEIDVAAEAVAAVGGATEKSAAVGGAAGKRAAGNSALEDGAGEGRAPQDRAPQDRAADERTVAHSSPWPPGARRVLRITLTNRGPARWLAARRGPGGVAFEVRLETPEGDPDPHRPWLPLPVDLAPGESVTLDLPLRRPPGPARLTIEPLVLDGYTGERVTRPGAPRWVGWLGPSGAETPGEGPVSEAGAAAEASRPGRGSEPGSPPPPIRFRRDDESPGADAGAGP